MVLFAVTAGAGVVVWMIETTPAGRRWSRHLAREVRRAALYHAGRLEGLRYRMAGGEPHPTATDHVLADRVRSTIGPLEHRLDVPRIHVMARGHDVVLHGDVDSAEHAEVIEAAVRHVAGVHHVESHLAVGLIAGDTRPSEGAGPHAGDDRRADSRHRHLATHR